MKFENIKPEYIEIAKTIMKEIMYDNGMVNRWNLETYPKKHIKQIALAAQKFFDTNPDVLTDENIENICCGDYDDNIKSFGKLIGFNELSKAMNEYFG